MEVQEDASSFLTRAYKTGKCSDITIMNGLEEYRVHKHVLSGAIPYFDKMFSSEFSESTSQVIKLDFPSTVFDLIIEWAYCCKILITEDNAVKLFHLADYMNISKLTTECLNFLWNDISDSPLLELDNWINQIVTGEVHEIIDSYICTNFSDIVHTDSFLCYRFDTVDYIISLDPLHIDNEIQVFDAIIRWIQKSVERQSHLPKLLKKVHWVEINAFQFMNRVEKLTCIMHDRARPVIMAAIELMFYKSLKQIKDSDVVFGPRYASDNFHYAIRRKTDLCIEADNFNGDYGKIIFTENLTLSSSNFGDSHITEHCMDSDVVIRMDWKNKTYRLFKDSGRYCYFLLFGCLFRFNKNDRKIHFWKGERWIEYARLSDDISFSQSTIFTISKHEGGICISIIYPAFCYDLNSSDLNHREYKSSLTIKKCTLPGNKFKVVASHVIVTKERIKVVKSTILHDLLVIFVDCSLILSYDFQKNIFKEHKNSDINGGSLCFLRFHSVFQDC